MTKTDCFVHRIIDLWHMREGYGSRFVSVCVCVSVTTLAATYLLVYYVENRVPLSFLCCFLHMHGVDSLKTLFSEVLVTFVDHLCLLCFLTDF